MTDFISNMSDGTARVLANENIIVSRNGAIKTPYFDLIKREVVLPLWENIDSTAIEAVTLHEIGHALFTPLEYQDHAKTSPVFAAYLNIVEDARIERLFKEKYQGSRKTFNSGYKIFRDINFFEIDSTTVNERILVDRINLFYKLGSLCGVKFTKEEHSLVKKVGTTSSFEDVVEVARELYDLEKKRKKEEQAANAEKENEVFSDETKKHDGLPIEDGSSEDGSSEDGSSEDGSSEDGSSEDGSSEDGSSEDGSSEGKSSEGKSSEGDSSEDGSSEDGSSEDGSSEGDSSEDGSSEGKSSEGDSSEGKSSEGKSSEGKSSEGKSSEGDSSEGVSSEGDSSEGESSEGDSFDESTIAPRTASTLEEKMQQFACNSRVIDKFYEISEDYTGSNIVLSYKKLANAIIDYDKSIGEINAVSKKTRFDNFKKKSNKQVVHLINQFNMKKSAEIYAKRKIAKTGIISTNRLSQYKIVDDIFKRNIVVSEGKNHGMIMLLDWSGSMSSGDGSDSGSTLQNSIEQTIMLVMFCRNVGIPHRVYAFSNSLSTWLNNNPGKLSPDYNESSLTLIEIFAEGQTNLQFVSVASTLLCGFMERMFPLYRTPLNPALAALRKYIPKFKSETQVDKISLIVFTDGENTEKCYSKNRPDFGYNDNTFVRDSITKKSYLIGTSGCGDHRKETTALYHILKDRYGISILTFFALVSRVFNIQKVRNAGCYVHNNEYVHMNAAYKKDGFVEVEAPGRDKNFVVDTRILSVPMIGKIGISENMTASKIAATLVKDATASTKSKILLTKFMELIS